MGTATAPDIWPSGQLARPGRQAEAWAQSIANRDPAMTVHPTLQTLSSDLADAVAQAAPGLVAVHAGRHALSGVVWHDGMVVSAEEALERDDDLTVTRPDGVTVPAELVGRDPSTDVALLKANTGHPPERRTAEAPPAGALALAVGRDDTGPMAAFGVVAVRGGPWTSAHGGRIDALVRLSFTMPRAIEGGAVMAADGACLGLAAAGPRRQGLLIPAATVDRAVSALAEKGYVARGYLGVGLHPLGRDGPGGALVTEVADGSPSRRGGLMIGDIIATWNGEAVGTPHDIWRRLGPDAVGQSVVLGLIRAGQTIEATVSIGERPTRYC